MPLAAVHLQAQHGHAQACPQEQRPCGAREKQVWNAVSIEYSVYREPFSAQQ
jgi:hypothetical protein